MMVQKQKQKSFFDNAWVKNISFILFCLQAEWVIGHYANKMENLEASKIEELNYRRAFINCFYDLGCNPLKNMPNSVDYNKYTMEKKEVKKDSSRSFYDAKGTVNNDRLLNIK